MILRIISAPVYHALVISQYGGAADSFTYYNWGVFYSEQFLQFNFSPIWDPYYWRMSKWWGTSFMSIPAGFFVSLSLGSRVGSFLLGSFPAFLGCIYFIKVFKNTFGSRYLYYFTLLMMFFPALWFWTSAITKDGLVFFGVAMTLLGFLNGKRSPSFFPIILGAGLVFCIRPQVIMLVAVCLGAAYFFTNARVSFYQRLFVLLFGIPAVLYAIQTIGLEASTESLEEYIGTKSSGTDYGGSSIEIAGGPLSGIINVLLRPFPFEVGSVFMLLSSMEIYFIWMLFLRRRRSIALVLSHLRRDRLILFSVVFVLLFSALAGQAMSNLGLIARQRIIVLPFLFMLPYTFPNVSKRVFYAYFRT